MSDAPLPVRKRELPENPAEISELLGQLSIDQKKVKISVELSNDTTRPDLDLVLQDANGEEVGHSTIIENFGSHFEFTMHVRHSGVPMPLRLTCKLSYEEEKVQSEKTVFVEQLA